MKEDSPHNEPNGAHFEPKIDHGEIARIGKTLVHAAATVRSCQIVHLCDLIQEAEPTNITLIAPPFEFEPLTIQISGKEKRRLRRKGKK